jgi:hypothetical protein
MVCFVMTGIPLLFVRPHRHTPPYARCDFLEAAPADPLLSMHQVSEQLLRIRQYMRGTSPASDNRAAVSLFVSLCKYTTILGLECLINEARLTLITAPPR